MRALTTAELLAVWEQGSSLSPIHRALLLLRAAFPDNSAESLAALSIGERDRRLLSLRELAFGSRIEGFATCPCCNEKLEMAFDTSDLRQAVPSEPAREPYAVQVGEHSVTFRLPNSFDLLEISSSTTAHPDGGETQLLRRCICAVHAGDSEAATVDLLPDLVVAAVAARMAEIDPQADVQLALTCPVCTQAWSEPFDIVTFFWREIEPWAQRILREIHTLASVYGWTETEIVALSPQRRQRYLEMIAG